MAVRRLHAQVGARDAAILLLLIALALILRAARLDFQPLWWDEGYSVWFAHHPLPEMLRLTAQDIHPPLYYAVLGGWSQIFGLTPVALRLLSVLIGLLAVPLAWIVGRRLGGRRAGLLAAFLFAISPLAIFYAQEIRMYALVALWALAAVGAAARWLAVGEGRRGSAREKKETRERRETTARGERWLVAYVAALALALYTQYYAAFLLLGLAAAGLWVLWRQHAPLSRFGWWIGAQVTVALLYLPWLRYATPKLAAYVSQKVVADSDRPLGLLTYLARHLSAYNAGHMEGPLASWWFVGLIGLLPLAWACWRLWTQRHGQLSTNHAQLPIDNGQPPSSNWQLTVDHSQLPIAHSLGFLLITFVTILVLGWLVNLTFPFFPERGERLLLMGLPVYLLLVAVAVAAATTNRAAPTNSALDPPVPSLSPFASLLLFLPFLLLAALSLAAFYTVPRYADEDYRPLIGQVTQWGRPQDTVLAVFPWQVGYFWSYGQSDGPQPVLSPDAAWTPAVVAALNTALASGHLWFPEHLSLGGILEGAIEQYLTGVAYSLANRWYSSSTRLTGWATPSGDQTRATADEPVTFSNGLTLRTARFGPLRLEAANAALLLDLTWDASAASGAPEAGPHISLRLADAEGRSWAQQDYTSVAGGGPDRAGLLIPSGTPPGVYDLLLRAGSEATAAPWDIVGPDGRSQGIEATLGQVQVIAPATPPATTTLPIDQPVGATLGDAARLLGFSAPKEPLAPGDDLAVSLFWQTLPGMAGATGDLSAFVQLLDDAGQVQAAWEGPPVAWHPTSAWQTGELVRSQHALRLPAALADGRYRLIAGLFDPATGQRMASSGGLLRAMRDYVPLAQIAVVGREHVLTAPQPQYPLPAELSRLGRLVGFDLSATDVAPGGQIDLTLHWQAQETTGDRLSVFVHLLDAQGDFLAQSDGEPGGAALPTSSWLPGEYLADRHVLTVRSDAPAGPASLVVGLYDPHSGARVPWLDASGQPLGDQLLLPVGIRVDRETSRQGGQ